MPANFQKTVLALLVSGNNVPNQFVSGVCSYSCEGCYRPEGDRWRSDLFGEEGILQAFPRHPSLSHGPGMEVRRSGSQSRWCSRWPGGPPATSWSPNRCSLVHVSHPCCAPVCRTCFTPMATRRPTLCHALPGQLDMLEAITCFANLLVSLDSKHIFLCSPV